MRATDVLLLLAALASVPVAAQSPNDAVALATFHASRAGLACAACHPEGDPASLAPEAALAAANRQCQGCHGDSAQVAKASRPKLADPNINPHASHPGGNRLGGNAMTALFTFGPIAGREAATRALG